MKRTIALILVGVMLISTPADTSAKTTKTEKKIEKIAKRYATSKSRSKRYESEYELLEENGITVSIPNLEKLNKNLRKYDKKRPKLVFTAVYRRKG